jgi:hypothetical protein
MVYQVQQDNRPHRSENGEDTKLYLNSDSIFCREIILNAVAQGLLRSRGRGVSRRCIPGRNEKYQQTWNVVATQIPAFQLIGFLKTPRPSCQCKHDKSRRLGSCDETCRIRSINCIYYQSQNEDSRIELTESSSTSELIIMTSSIRELLFLDMSNSMVPSISRLKCSPSISL